MVGKKEKKKIWVFVCLENIGKTMKKKKKKQRDKNNNNKKRMKNYYFK